MTGERKGRRGNIKNTLEKMRMISRPLQRSDVLLCWERWLRGRSLQRPWHTAPPRQLHRRPRIMFEGKIVARKGAKVGRGNQGTAGQPRREQWAKLARPWTADDCVVDIEGKCRFRKWKGWTWGRNHLRKKAYNDRLLQQQEVCTSLQNQVERVVKENSKLQTSWRSRRPSQKSGKERAKERSSALNLQSS